jgi:hypothetical protein
VQLRRHIERYHDSPVPRPTQSPQEGKVIAIPLLGGLHHHYVRQAALPPDLVLIEEVIQIIAPIPDLIA